MDMIKLSLAMLTGLALVIGADQSSIAAAKVFYVGTCKPGKADFTTIQEAVSGVPPGSTIDVCPGVYPEQVTVTQPLTLQGVQSGNNAQVMITAPAGGILVATVPLAEPTLAQVAVQNSGGAVDISGLTVDGTGITSGGVTVAGILYNSSPGTINQVVTQNLQPPGVGAVGIFVRDELAVSPAVTVQNSAVSFANSFNTSGIAADTVIGRNGSQFITSGGMIALSITDNYVSGAEGGIDVEFGVAATVTGNVVTGGSVTNAQGVSFAGDGIVTGFNTGPVKINNNSIVNVSNGVLLQSQQSTGSTTVSNNTVSSSDAGIFLSQQSGSTTINGNQLITPAAVTSSASAKVGVNFDCIAPLPTVSGNTVLGASIGLASVPSGASLQKNAGTFVNVPNVELLCQ
jgi:parallel beta-helix repeat protein